MLTRFNAGIFLSIAIAGVTTIAGGTTIAGIAGMVYAQDYPHKPVRLVTSEVGGGSDVAARIFAQAFSGLLGQPAIVDNRGNMAAVIVAKSPVDGYTLLFWGTNVWLTPLMRNSAWDPIRDLAPVTMAVSSPNVLVVHPSLAVNSVKELIVLAKAKPGQLNGAAATAGASSQLALELFKSMTGVDIARIPYKGNGPAVTGVIGGESQLMFGTAASVASYVKSGKLRSVAVTSARPSALFPGVPTVAATVPGYESTSSWGLFGPIKTPPPLIKKLNQEAVRALQQPAVKEKFFSLGVETFASTPEEFGAMIKSEIARMGKVIKEAGIREE